MLEIGWPTAATIGRWQSASDAEVYDELNAAGIGDGLPVVRPTLDKIEAFVRAAGLRTTSPVATIPLFNTEATAEGVAVCGILAGCVPAQMPVLRAAARALGQPGLNGIGLLSTTGSAALAAIVNGPLRGDLGFNALGNCLGPGSRANATTGRAIAFMTRGLGGAVAGLTDMSTMGQPAKYTFCFAENEEESPWDAFHVEHGFRPEQSTITLIGVAGTIEIVNAYATTPPEMFDLAARTISGTSGLLLDAESTISGGQPLLIVSPEWARTFEQHKISKSEVKQALFDRVSLPLEVLPPKQIEQVQALRREAGGAPDAPLRIARSPQDIHLVVAGGVGIKQTYVPNWSGGSKATTVAV